MKTPVPQRVSTAYKARVVIDSVLDKQIRYFVDKVTTECQWYTQVKREEVDDEIVYYLYGNILIPPQKVGATDVDMDQVAVMQMWQEQTKLLKDEFLAGEPSLTTDELDSVTDPVINSRMKTAWNWCHSHVDMEVKPSTTDNDQWRDWVQMHQRSGVEDHPPMMMIINKSGNVFVRVYDSKTRIQFESIPVEIDASDPDLESVILAINTKLSKIEEKEEASNSCYC